MTFILIPKQGEDVQVNAWNWRPTLELLRAENLLTEENYERLAAQGCRGSVDAVLAHRIADVIERKLATMKPGERIRADLSVTAIPKEPQVFQPKTKADDIDINNLYSATYDWLTTFKEFCRRSEGFEVS
jgi:hypothetical protein